jgi:hypothetical protein
MKPYKEPRGPHNINNFKVLMTIGSAVGVMKPYKEPRLSYIECLITCLIGAIAYTAGIKMFLDESSEAKTYTTTLPVLNGILVMLAFSVAVSLFFGIFLEFIMELRRKMRTKRILKPLIVREMNR